MFPLWSTRSQYGGYCGLSFSPLLESASQNTSEYKIDLVVKQSTEKAATKEIRFLYSPRLAVKLKSRKYFYLLQPQCKLHLPSIQDNQEKNSVTFVTRQIIISHII